MKAKIQISYATIDAGSESGLYDVVYGEPVGAYEARRWVISPPKSIRDHLKPGMILIARDKPYRVIGFSLVQDDGSLLSRHGDSWFANNNKIPTKDEPSLEQDLFVNIARVGEWEREKTIFNVGMNNRHWSKQWQACTASNPIGLKSLSGMYNYVCDSTILTSRIVSDVLRAAVNSYPKSAWQNVVTKDELITADQASNILNAYVEGEIAYEQFLEICNSAYEDSKNNPKPNNFSLMPIDGMLRSVEGNIDTWASDMSERFGLDSEYEARKIIIKTMKDDIGLNNMLYMAMIYSMMQDVEKEEF